MVEKGLLTGVDRKISVGSSGGDCDDVEWHICLWSWGGYLN